jgi:hypothetical protein
MTTFTYRKLKPGFAAAELLQDGIKTGILLVPTPGGTRLLLIGPGDVKRFRSALAARIAGVVLSREYDHMPSLEAGE